MTATRGGAAVRCPSCGASGSGSYCSQCGARLQAGEQSGWTDAVGDVAAGAGAFGVFHTLTTLLRSPVSATIALTEDSGYKGQLKFFTTTTAAFFAFFVVIVPTLLASYYRFPASHLTGDDPGSRKLVMTIWYYIILVPVLFATYYLLALRATRKRTPREFIKLALIGQGFLNAAAIGITAVALPLVMIFGPTMAFAATIDVGVILVQAIYATCVYRDFWHVDWKWAAFVVATMFVVGFASGRLVYPH